MCAGGNDLKSSTWFRRSIKLTIALLMEVMQSSANVSRQVACKALCNACATAQYFERASGRRGIGSSRAVAVELFIREVGRASGFHNSI